MNNYQNEYNNSLANSEKTNILILIILLMITATFFIFIFNKNENEEYYINLLGNEVISIYENSTYIEPGFKGFNNNNEDLTSLVIVSSNIDTSKPGTYTITYKLNNIKSYRTVKVIPKDINNTKIELKGNATIYLNINDTYIEPGFTANDTIDGNITDIVEVSNNIDTKKAGEYQIIYSVVSSSGITASAYRKVIIKASETKFNLSLSNNNKTEKPIDIKVEIIDDNFNYLVLPNNKTVTNKTYSYQVTKNGTYKFTYYNKSGNKQEKNITVSNLIDIPSATVKTSDNKNESNNIHNVGFQIKLISNASSLYYCLDSNNTCNPNIKYINQLTFLSSTNKYLRYTSCNNDGICKTPNSYKINLNINLDNPKVSTSTSTRYGMKNPYHAAYYYQADERWKNYDIYKNNSMAASGCGYNAFAMLLTGLTHDYSITPLTLIEKLKKYRSTNGIEFQYPDQNGALLVYIIDTHTLIKNEYNYDSSKLWRYADHLETKTKKEKVVSSLKMGHMILANVPGHYIAFVGITENEKIYVFDPATGTFLKDIDTLYNDYKDIIAAYEVYPSGGISLDKWKNNNFN